MPVGNSAPVPVAGKNELPNPVPGKLLDRAGNELDGTAVLDAKTDAKEDSKAVLDAKAEAEAAVGKNDEGVTARRTTSRFLISSAGAAEANRAVRPRRVVRIAVFIFAGRIDR